MAKGEREGFKIPLHPLSLDECGASSSASLLTYLSANEPVTSSAKGDLSSLSITPERVAKVIAIEVCKWSKDSKLVGPKTQHKSQIQGGSGQDLLSGFSSWWREAGCSGWRQMGKGPENYHQ